ncbi:MAG: adenosylcobalamin-dependent ribonucleoside-diphosphate reductase [Deltaproteobacteria bacterium]|nr:adenosylcobalamin-dependent ribonucleoside-diphosphate reductase [Deltaproteobacteria bacterium]
MKSSLQNGRDTQTPKLTDNALRVMRSRYLRQDRNRHIRETPAQLFQRVAKAVAQAELLFGHARDADRREEEFLLLLNSLDFLPNSPTLMNAGTPLGQLSACFVLPISDTMESIFETLKTMALVQRTGGGTGFSFSALRPQGDLVASTSGSASGPVSFMKIFDGATYHIKQGGKRRGANMGVLRVDHPDIMDFIRAKTDEGALQNFNLSVLVTDAFMQAVQRDESYDLLHPRERYPTGSVRAKEVFDAIVQAAWETGDPGLIFQDAVNRANPTPQLGPITATNPCGEIPLLGFESCTLGSVNLAHMLDRQDRDIEEEQLRQTVQSAIRFLDNVIEINRYPVDAIEQMTRGTRKTGLGVMGFSEMLIRLGISYDSDEAVSIADRIMKCIQDEAFKTSVELARERGVYPFWRGSIHEQKGINIRNAARTAIAPTGTIGIIADTTPGIEPLFALAYRRAHVLDGETLYEINPLFRSYAAKYGVDTEDLMAQLGQRGTLSAVEGIPTALKNRFITALEIPPHRHLQVQAAFQRHVDSSVSKTINMAEEKGPQEMSEIYMQAWKLGLKGITVYRHGSKPDQVIQLGTDEQPHQYDHHVKCDPEECTV